MRVAAILVCAIAAVVGDLSIDIDLNDIVCPLDAAIQKIFPHKYCNMFYQCSNGFVIELHCAGDLLFNTVTLECDWSYNVDCGSRNISDSKPEQTAPYDSDENEGACNDDPTEAPQICADSDSDGVLVAHEYCNQFYKCSNQEPISLRCPRNLLFNPCKDKCDWAENVDCGNRTISEDNDDDNGGDITTTEKPDPVDNNPVDAEEICAQENSNGVLVAHEYCNWFYICFDELPVAHRCPKDLVFNPVSGQCDWTSNVNCGNKTITEPEDDDNGGENITTEKPDPVDNNPVDANEICAQEDSDGVLVAHEYCNWFYICYDELPVAHNCPKDLVFNPVSEKCDWSYNVNCGNKTISEPEDDDNGNGGENITTEKPEPVDNNPVDANEICAQEDSDGILVAHEYCNWFYNCFDQQPVAAKCPGHLVFNPVREECDWSYNVNCGDKPISEPEDDDNGGENITTEKPDPVDNNPVDANKICAQEESDDVLVAHEYCNWFYNCFEKQPIARRCPGDLVFNPVRGACDWRSNVNCGNKTISDDEEEVFTTTEVTTTENNGPFNDNPDDASTICAQADSTGILIAHKNCDQFYICSLNGPIVMRCTPGTLYNYRVEKCDWPEKVDCGERIVPDESASTTEAVTQAPNSDPSEASEICSREGSDGVLIAHTNCNQYFKCSNGKPKALRCSSNLLYDIFNGWCDWPERVVCGDRVVPDTGDDSSNDDPANASGICARSSNEGALVAHENCNQFYKCSHGEPVEITCQSGLQYSTVLQLCDWPSNVECGDRKQ
ncbi:chitin-binding domain protein cbd-1 [Bicyclus anynana]|uniref:Chitin-binding domain protein cbd-1 n=1 Tax=Bicyclus anynana TaxID=110368 RepID=A0A6J1NJ37_BICAN|nr:chitin-binding domain protein cbd-1 [Bicyclus anynana]